MRQLSDEGGAAGVLRLHFPGCVPPAVRRGRGGAGGAALRGGAGGGGAGGAGPARRGAAAALRAGADLAQGRPTGGPAGDRAGAAPADRSVRLQQRRTARFPATAEMSAGECGDRGTGTSLSWIAAQQEL